MRIVWILFRNLIKSLLVLIRGKQKIRFRSGFGWLAYKPTTGSKPISSAYAMAVGNATAATDTPATASCRSHSRRYPSKFRSPSATRRTEGIFLRAPDGSSIHPHGKFATATSPRPVSRSTPNEVRSQRFCHFRASLLNTFRARTDGWRSRRCRHKPLFWIAWAAPPFPMALPRRESG